MRPSLFSSRCPMPATTRRIACSRFNSFLELAPNVGAICSAGNLRVRLKVRFPPKPPLAESLFPTRSRHSIKTCLSDHPSKTVSWVKGPPERNVAGVTTTMLPGRSTEWTA